MRILTIGLIGGLLAAGAFAAEDAEPAESQGKGLIPRETVAPEGFDIAIPRGTRVPLVLINSISTKNAAPGDRIYLESVYPVVVDGRIVIPPGTYVSGSVTSSTRAGRVKGKAELYLLFEQMILPNGIIRDLVGRVGSLDGRSPENLDREEGKITSESGKGSDTRRVAETTVTGTSIGAIAGAVGGNAGAGVGIGAAAGAAVGVASVLLTRGPEAVLEKGAQLDMMLDRDLYFTTEDLTFEDPLGASRARVDSSPGPNPNRNKSVGAGPLPF